MILLFLKECSPFKAVDDFAYVLHSHCIINLIPKIRVMWLSLQDHQGLSPSFPIYWVYDPE